MKEIHGQYSSFNTVNGPTSVLINSSVFKNTNLPSTTYTDISRGRLNALKDEMLKDPKVAELGCLIDSLMNEYDCFSTVEDMLYSLELL